MTRISKPVGWTAAVLCLTGCASVPPDPPDAVLKQSMETYRSLTSFSATSDWDASSGSSHYHATRTFDYQTPNHFKFTSVHDNTLLLASVCDGSQVTEYSNMPGMTAQIYPPPSTMADATTPQMTSPLDCRSPIVSFFTGSGGYSKLVAQAGASPKYGPNETIDGQRCAGIDFQSVDYGHVLAMIGLRDHLVHRITYTAGRLAARVNTTATALPPFTAPLPPQPSNIVVTETFQHINTAAQYADSDFDTGLPADIPPLTPQGGQPGAPGSASGGPVAAVPDLGKPPVPLGSAAPDADVVDARTGQHVRISSLHGHVVLLDFWATWCEPCRMSLPETQRLYDTYHTRGLDVMGVDNESASDIVKFANNNHYTFPEYVDADQSAASAYGASAIPCLVVIDRNGRLASYMVGLQDKGTAEAAIHKAGL
ncbi:MAG: TlpA family protein disulfide reductase [Capsulimonadaceae bacterium]